MSWLVSPTRRTLLALIPIAWATILSIIAWRTDSVGPRLTVISGLLTTAVTASAAVYAAASLHISVRRDRQGRAFALLAVLNLQDVAKALTACDRLATSYSSDALVKRLAVEEEERAAVRLVLFHLEDIAIAIEEDHAEEQVLFRSLHRMVPFYWEAFREYIEAERKVLNTDTFLSEFEILADAWRNSQSLRDQTRLSKRGRVQTLG